MLSNIKKSVPIIKRQIEISRRLVGDHNRSVNFQKILTEQQNLIGAPNHTLIQVKFKLDY